MARSAVNRKRLRSAFDAWKAREVVSNRLLGTGVGLAAIGLPLSLWSLVVGPTAGDRLVALGFLAGTMALAVYSLWEAKNVEIGRPRPLDREP